MVSCKRPLAAEEACAAMKEIMAGEASQAQIGAFLVALQNQPLDPALVKECAAAMVSFANPCAVQEPQMTMDIVGTGGDGLDTFNVSTAAGMVLAAAGVKCAKHGNRSASGSVGSADFLEALGCNIKLNGEQVATAVDECGFGFLFAQMFHPAMRHVAAARKEIGVRTVFNLLGPLTNPANPGLQVIGVGKKELGPLFAELFKLKGAKRAMIVHSAEGLDEISPAGKTFVWMLDSGTITEKEISPADFGVDEHKLEDVQGGSAADRASIFREILAGGKKRKGATAAHTAIADYIIINAAPAIMLAGKAKDLKSAAQIARTAMENGAALKVLDAYIALTKRVAPETPAVNGSAGGFTTRGGVRVTRTEKPVDCTTEVEKIVDALDGRKGLLMMSTFEYPGRYTRWKTAFVDPPLQFASRDLTGTLTALNLRGRVLIEALKDWFDAKGDLFDKVDKVSQDELRVRVRPSADKFTEEQRSRQPSIFTLVREIIACMFSDADEHMGLYGAFGYDLTFQFEPCRMRLSRPATQRDLVLFIPDQVLIVGYEDSSAKQVSYEFSYKSHSTEGQARTGSVHKFTGSKEPARRDHEKGEYAALVTKAKEEFKCGNLFEVVCSQTFYEPCPAPPSELHRRIRERNPSPFSFIINLGNDEFLVGASPEMYVRSKGSSIETCPISGTIKRGATAIEDAQNIKELLNNEKEESEITMCTDVDRNDKSRICKPGSVQVVGRRQIEMYSRLIHTVDHVKGELREGFDALDAFLAHTWAVTVTGAPKAWAMQFLEDNERTCRAWYGGSVGHLGFDGNINTGLTLRTIRIIDGIAQVRAGATLLFDSDPPAEEAETELKASAFIEALRVPRTSKGAPKPGAEAGAANEGGAANKGCAGKRILLIDHQDSFVHTLANYLRQTGADVVTIRSHPGKVGLEASEIDRLSKEGGAFALAVLSPGPGNPTDFQVPATIVALCERQIPIFGVCLGLQGIIEKFGGVLGQLPTPMHGKPSTVKVVGDMEKGIFAELPDEIMCGRYHSLFAHKMPDCLEVTAKTEDGCIMAVRHKTLPIAAVQFHPESILTQPGAGVRMLTNAVLHLSY